MDLIPKLKTLNFEERETTFGKKIKPFGLGKLKILELVHLSLKIPVVYNVNVVIKEQEIFKTLMVFNYIYLFLGSIFLKEIIKDFQLLFNNKKKIN